MINEENKAERTVFTNIEISPLMFDFYFTLQDIKKIETVENVYLNFSSYKLEIYVYYTKEDFKIEDLIIQKLVDFETTYKYFPEIFIYPLDMIESKELTLPKTAKEV